MQGKETDGLGKLDQILDDMEKVLYKTPFFNDSWRSARRARAELAEGIGQLLLKAYHAGKQSGIETIKKPIDEKRLFAGPELLRELGKSAGFVYIVGDANDSNVYKIGRARNISRRMKGLRSKNRSLYLVAHAITKDAKALERKLHGRFAFQCVGGEWFKLSTADIEEAFAIFSEHGAEETPN